LKSVPLVELSLLVPPEPPDPEDEDPDPEEEPEPLDAPTSSTGADGRSIGPSKAAACDIPTKNTNVILRLRNSG
jgi:hypothetical protein